MHTQCMHLQSNCYTKDKNAKEIKLEFYGNVRQTLPNQNLDKLKEKEGKI